MPSDNQSILAQSQATLKRFIIDALDDRLVEQFDFDAHFGEDDTLLLPFELSEADVGHVRNLKVLLNITHEIDGLMNGESAFTDAIPFGIVKNHIRGLIDKHMQAFDLKTLADTKDFLTKQYGEASELSNIFLGIIDPLVLKFNQDYRNRFNGRDVDHITDNFSLDQLLMSLRNARDSYDRFNKGAIDAQIENIGPAFKQLSEVAKTFKDAKQEHGADTVAAAKQLIHWIHRVTIDIDDTEERLGLKPGYLFDRVAEPMGLSAALIEAAYDALREHQVSMPNYDHAREQSRVQRLTDAKAELQSLQDEMAPVQALQTILNEKAMRPFSEYTEAEILDLSKALQDLPLNLSDEDRDAIQEALNKAHQPEGQGGALYNFAFNIGANVSSWINGDNATWGTRLQKAINEYHDKRIREVSACEARIELIENREGLYTPIYNQKRFDELAAAYEHRRQATQVDPKSIHPEAPEVLSQERERPARSAASAKSQPHKPQASGSSWFDQPWIHNLISGVSSFFGAIWKFIQGIISFFTGGQSPSATGSTAQQAAVAKPEVSANASHSVNMSSPAQIFSQMGVRPDLAAAQLSAAGTLTVDQLQDALKAVNTHSGQTLDIKRPASSPQQPFQPVRRLAEDGSALNSNPRVS